jgi:hypothetical protein
MTCKMDYLAAVATLRCAEMDLELAKDSRSMNYPSCWGSNSDRHSWTRECELSLTSAQAKLAEASANLRKYKPAIRDYVDTALAYNKAWQIRHVEDNIKTLESWLDTAV